MRPTAVSIGSLSHIFTCYPPLPGQAKSGATAPPAPVYAVVTNCTYDGLSIDCSKAEGLLGGVVDRLHFDEVSLQVLERREKDMGREEGTGVIDGARSRTKFRFHSFPVCVRLSGPVRPFLHQGSECLLTYPN